MRNTEPHQDSGKRKDREWKENTEIKKKIDRDDCEDIEARKKRGSNKEEDGSDTLQAVSKMSMMIETGM